MKKYMSNNYFEIGSDGVNMGNMWVSNMWVSNIGTPFYKCEDVDIELNKLHTEIEYLRRCSETSYALMLSGEKRGLDKMEQAYKELLANNNKITMLLSKVYQGYINHFENFQKVYHPTMQELSNFMEGINDE